jgi:hypothetical protein
MNCVRQAFRGLLPGVLERHQRHTPRLAGQIRRRRARAPAVLAMEVPRHIAVCVLLRLPLPAPRVPRVPGVETSPCVGVTATPRS